MPDYRKVEISGEALMGLNDERQVRDRLQTLLGLPEPAYHHHRLILDDDGRKLSKSTRATALRELRAGGATPGDIARMVGLAP